MVAALLLTVSSALALEVEVHGVAGEGRVGCALFVAEDGFPDDERKALATVEVEASTARGAVVVCRFEDVSAPRIAVAIQHDQNGNGKLDTNWLGVPREPFGFSNDAAPRAFGPPRFEDAAIDNARRIRVRLR